VDIEARWPDDVMVTSKITDHLQVHAGIAVPRRPPMRQASNPSHAGRSDDL
jgi:hypothetical protein